MIELKLAVCSMELANGLREPCRTAAAGNDYEKGLALLDALNVPHVQVGVTGVIDREAEIEELGGTLSCALHDPTCVVDIRIQINDTDDAGKIAGVITEFYKAINEWSLKYFQSAIAHLFHGIEKSQIPNN